MGTFSVSRPLFMREKLNKTYSTGSYFWGKSLADLPFDFCYPLVTVSIIYFVVGLNQEYIEKFFILCGICILTY